MLLIEMGFCDAKTLFTFSLIQGFEWKFCVAKVLIELTL